MLYYIKLYIATLIVFFAIDLLWLGLAARTFYRKYIGFLLAPSPNWFAAIIFYLLFILGLLFFVIVPGLKENSFKIIFLHAALFGLITYSTYDLTNLATVKNWPLVVTVVDMIWGTVLSVAVSVLSFMVGKWLS
jgi:uncharacterized membrane protein